MNIQVDELEFFVSRLMHSDIATRIVEQPISIKGKKSDGIELEVCKAYMVTELDGSTYSNWAVISEIGILLLHKIKLTHREVIYIEDETQLDNMIVYRNIHPNHVEKIRKDFDKLINPSKNESGS